MREASSVYAGVVAGRSSEEINARRACEDHDQGWGRARAVGIA